jgi:hypothetical protein
MIRAGIAVKANVSFIDVKDALVASGRNYNPECESCQ